MAAGDDPHTAVLLVARVQGQPGRHARPRLGAQVKVVLVQRLPARPGGLEVEHGLHGQRLVAQKRAQALGNALVQQPAAG